MTAQTKPAKFVKAVTKSDTVDIDFENKSHATRGVYVGAAGSLSVEMAGDRDKGDGLSDPTVVFQSVLSGTLLPISITRVNATGSSASSIVAIW